NKSDFRYGSFLSSSCFESIKRKRKMIDNFDPVQTASICNSFRNGESISIDLAYGGKLVIDQKLPFICVYRYKDSPEFYLASLVRTQGAFLIVSVNLDVKDLLEKLIEEAVSDFKTFL